MRNHCSRLSSLSNWHTRSEKGSRSNHQAVCDAQQPVTAAGAVTAGLPAAAAYQANSLVVRLSVKLFNCTPGDLPQGLRDQLCNWLCATPAGAEGYIRPGCLHLTMQVPPCCPVLAFRFCFASSFCASLALRRIDVQVPRSAHHHMPLLLLRKHHDEG